MKDNKKKLTMLNKVLYTCACTLLISACGGSDVKVDHEKPESVVNAIFLSAKNDNTASLKGLCDPKGENDGDTRRICELTKDHEKWAEFKTYFAKGAAGETKVDGDTAEVQFKFGPDGTKDETMKMVKRDDKWYLSSF